MIRPNAESRASSIHPVPHASPLESLEARCLMSGNLLGTTTLRIVGDADADNLNDTIIIDVNPADESQLRVTVNGELLATRAIKRMKAITISAGLGDDTVQINVPGLRCGVTIHGGDGDDDITGSAKGDRIFAGAGDDTVNAGTGGDLVYGGLGDDHLDGQAGNDKLFGDAGDDTLLGASGRDHLVGGLGADDIFGRPRYDRIRLDDADTLHETQQTNPLEQGDLDADLRARLIDLAVEQYRYLLGTTQYYYWHWWSRDYGLPQVGLPGGGVVITAASPDDSPSNAPGGFDPTDHSTTNNQVTGVEEADIVKTDGHFIYTFDSGDLLTINANPDELAVMSRLAIEGYGQEMYLHGDRVTVISTIWDWIIDDPRPLPEKGDATGIEGDMLLARPAAIGIWMPRHRSDPRVKVTVIDVADRENPLVVEETYIDGSLTSSRSIGDDVYLVVQNDVSLPAPLYTDDGEGKTYTYETEDEYRARLEAMDIESFLPQVRTTGGEGEAGADDDITNSLLNPDNFHVPVKIENDNLISIAKINVADEFTGVDDSATTFGLSGVVYASTDAIYIAATNYDYAWDATGGVSTDIYKFNLGDDLAYAAGGSVKGAAFNQFALDEYDSTFRIVTRNFSWTDRSSTSLFVLEQSGSELNTIGSLTGIGKLESLQSVRFMGDRAFIVTFLQVDPLFAIDLSNPIKPKLRGELTIPGFSSYLHPIDANHLIGIGQGARPGTLKLSLFDVTNLDNPTETDSYTFDEDSDWSGSVAQWDHKAFSYFAAQGILAIPLNAWHWNPTTGSGNTNSLAVLEVNPATGFTRLSDVEHETPVQRSLRIGDLLYSLSLDTLKVNELLRRKP